MLWSDFALKRCQIRHGPVFLCRQLAIDLTDGSQTDCTLKLWSFILKQKSPNKKLNIKEENIRSNNGEK